MAHLQFEDALAARMAAMSPSAREKFTGQVPMPHYPFKVEQLLNSAVKSAFARIRYEQWVPSAEEVKNDDAYTVFMDVIRAVSALVESTAPISWPGVASMVTTALNHLFVLKSAEAKSYMKALLGNSVVPYSDAWWQDVEHLLRDELNRRLIKTIGEYNDKLAKYITHAVSKKLTYEETVSGIKSIMEDISDKRAAFLARDLTGTVNSLASQKMHVSVFGINTYIWVTAADERVRGTPRGPYASAIPSHYVMERVLCRWDNPTVFSVDGGKTWVPRVYPMPMVHTGIAWNCRCIPLAFFGGAVTATNARFKQYL